MKPAQRTPEDIDAVLPFLMNLKDLRENKEVQVSQEDLRSACTNMTFQSFKAGRIISEEGSCGQHYFIVLKGEVSILSSAERKIRLGQKKNEKDEVAR